MEIYLLNGSFDIISVLDNVTSCRIVKRFFSPGEFKFTVLASEGIRSAAEYMLDPTSGFCGVIEAFSYDGELLSVGGRSLEALLERRIIYGGGRYSGNVESAVRTAVEQNAIKKRPLQGLTLGSATGLAETGYLETSWSDLSSWVYSVLREFNASYSVTLDSVTDGLVFRVEKSRDRTRDSGYPVIFSENMGSIDELEISTDTTKERNVAYVRGSDGVCVVAGDEDLAGNARRECFVSASDILPNGYNGTDEYHAALRKRGEERLKGRKGKYTAMGRALDGPQYGKDYLLGDLCDVECESGIAFSAMVTSVTYEYTGGEAAIYPAFGEEETTLDKLVEEALNKKG